MASRPASMSCLTAFIILVLLALHFCSFQVQGASSKEEEEEDYVPVRSVVYRRRSVPAAVTTTEAAAYEPFQLCDGCRCCAASNSSNCVDTSCCYAIDCNIPGKPFGVCAFTPQSCGCGANNCTQPS
ncbi:hypothetical protein PR202_gb16566 [Eleusine coracana subsp. coracana]|uniref:DUF7866 domain-containing protein n=1 Tax=Eleusine coracana subsp. coracana TaxID=191504 RepID=A0AAV5F2E7_ELECO|nr:hypothetical protein QOZ80_9BG0696490 [Eleusine coracana subsp. coracana]GJN28441.1 hypothetical protein PR202_gb16566 [Eleusine coracana subsp. coracana]